jgi:hypothetical protein
MDAGAKASPGWATYSQNIDGESASEKLAARMQAGADKAAQEDAPKYPLSPPREARPSKPRTVPLERVVKSSTFEYAVRYDVRGAARGCSARPPLNRALLGTHAASRRVRREPPSGATFRCDQAQSNYLICRFAFGPKGSARLEPWSIPRERPSLTGPRLISSCASKTQTRHEPFIVRSSAGACQVRPVWAGHYGRTRRGHSRSRPHSPTRSVLHR